MSPENKSPVFIHLGLPKTATTLIRFNLFAKHSQIHYLGKFIGGGFPKAICPAVLSNLSNSTQVKSFDKGSIYQASIKKQLAYAEKNDLKPVLAQESLAGGRLQRKSRQAELFRSHFGYCKAILFVREPTSFLKSFYVQMLRNHNLGSTDGALQRMINLRAAPPQYFDVNSWMSRAWHITRKPQSYIRYADTAKAYADIFGRENVQIFIFEQFIREPKVFIQGLCDFIGIDKNEAFDLIREKRSNVRLTTAFIENIKRFEQTPHLRKEFLKASQEGRKKLLLPDSSQGEKINPVFSDKWLRKIDNLSRKQNQQLVKEWNLPIEKFGYKV